MQPIRSRVNQYRGINAHLHSHWQLEGGWAGFHTNHITDLMRLLRTQLLPMGYTAELESSLQIRHVDAMPESPESDVTIYDLESERTARPSGLPATMAGVLVLPAPEILARSPLSEKEFNSILAYLTKRPLMRRYMDLNWSITTNFLNGSSDIAGLIRLGSPGEWSPYWRLITEELIWKRGHFQSKRCQLRQRSSDLKYYVNKTELCMKT